MNDGTQGVDLVALLDTRESVLAELKEKREMLGRLDWQIERHLNAMTATFYENDGWTVELKSKIVWNEDALQPLVEFYSPDDAESLMNKPRPRTWNKTRLKKEARKGGEIGKIIAFAQEEGPAELQIKAKAKKDN
jgi:thymidylate synthase